MPILQFPKGQIISEASYIALNSPKKFAQATMYVGLKFSLCFFLEELRTRKIASEMEVMTLSGHLSNINEIRQENILANFYQECIIRNHRSYEL